MQELLWLLLQQSIGFESQSAKQTLGLTSLCWCCESSSWDDDLSHTANSVLRRVYWACWLQKWAKITRERLLHGRCLPKEENCGIQSLRLTSSLRQSQKRCWSSLETYFSHGWVPNLLCWNGSLLWERFWLLLPNDAVPSDHQWSVWCSRFLSSLSMGREKSCPLLLGLPDEVDGHQGRYLWWTRSLDCLPLRCSRCEAKSLFVVITVVWLMLLSNSKWIVIVLCPSS